MREFDAMIVGHGPAGCSAALYLCRAAKTAAIIGKDSGALERAPLIENYYGLAQPLRGADLVEVGRSQAKALGAAMFEDEVTALEWREDGSFLAALASGEEIAAKTALLATGKAKRSPDIPGLAALEGKGVSYCAVCDAFLYRNRTVAVLGAGQYAKAEAEHLLPLARTVCLLTNGEEPQFSPPPGLRVIQEEIICLSGTKTLEAIELESNETLLCDGLFVALGSASAGELARKMGVPLKNGAIPVDETQATVLPGLFAAGDCTGSFAQVAFAVAEGARAGMAMAKFLRQ